MWIFKNKNIVTIKYTREGECRTDLQECKCAIEVEQEDKTIKEEVLSNYDMENKYYKIKQDLMPYWSNWSECNAYGIKNRKRMYGPRMAFDVFDIDGTRKGSSDLGDLKNYRLYSCDLVPCENSGLNENDQNECRLRSDGLDTSDEGDNPTNINTNSCDPIITFQTTTDIVESCVNDAIRLPFLNVDFSFDQDISVDKGGTINYNRNFYSELTSDSSSIINSNFNSGTTIGYKSEYHNDPI